MYKKISNLICFILMCSFLFSMPLAYAQEANNEIVLDINGLKPSDYDKNGWAKTSDGKWVSSPLGAKFRDIREDSWVPFIVDYNEVSGDHALFFLQLADGIGLDSKNKISVQQVSIQLLQEKIGNESQVNIVFDLIPQGKDKSLRDTWFSSEEDGFLSIEDSRGAVYDYELVVSPGKTVEVRLKDMREFISLLHQRDTYNAVIGSEKGNWACLFKLNGFLPIVRNNWSPKNTGGLKYLPVEGKFQLGRKGGMSIGKKIITGIAIAAVVALAIYGGYTAYQYINNDPADIEIINQATYTAGTVPERAQQVHHFASNKNTQFTPEYRDITNKYNLDLNGDWNKMAFDTSVHSGRHSVNYHNFVLEGMKKASSEAGSNTNRFIELFNQYVKQPVAKDPSILYK